MLSFRWVFGDMTDNTPGEIPKLLADLANVTEEYVDVGFEKGITELASSWTDGFTSQIWREILCLLVVSMRPMMRRSLRSGACWTRGG